MTGLHHILSDFFLQLWQISGVKYFNDSYFFMQLPTQLYTALVNSHLQKLCIMFLNIIFKIENFNEKFLVLFTLTKNHFLH